MTFSDIVTGLIPFLLQGLSVTVSVSFFALAIGLVLGLVLSVFRVYGAKPVRTVLILVSVAARSVPQMVLLLLIYFAIAGSVNLSPYWAGTLSLAMISAAYQMEIFRGALQSVDGGQMMAARAIGMSNGKAIRKIIIPQALRSAIPAWSNEASIVIKSSSLVYYVGVQEIMRMAQYRNARLHEPLLIYSTVALIYFVLTFITNRSLKIAENRLKLPEC